MLHNRETVGSGMETNVHLPKMVQEYMGWYCQAGKSHSDGEGPLIVIV